MTDGTSNFTFDPNSIQISTRLRANSDFNSSQKLVDVPLNGKNYIPWAKAITLKGKGLLGVINDNKTRPAIGVEAQKK
jgi:hypothetical protein